MPPAKNEIRDRIEAQKARLLHEGRFFLKRTLAGVRFPAFALPGLRKRSLTLPRGDRPRASIIIPVYGKIATTWACLQSLARETQKSEFEVIVVDDCSPDDTAEVLQRVGGITVVQNEKNLGFIGACNAGAARARADYLCFLNNDTQVVDAWLDELLDTFAREPDAGLVGARLVYPDGRLQESGGIVFADGSAANYGRLDDPDRPAYSYLREADYCSGACIVIPNSLFCSLGGFDSFFAPAYYEDTDLAFRVRRAGKRVYVQPAARVVHFEGVTSGTDTTKGVKRHQPINREKFVARWGELLRREQPAPQTPLDVAKDRGVARRMLLVDSIVPRPDHDAGSLRMYNMMQLARRAGMKVSFIPMEIDARFASYVTSLERSGVEVLRPPYFVSVRHALRVLGPTLDAVLLSRVDNVEANIDAVRTHAPHARAIFDTVDLHYVREEREARLLGDAQQLVRVAKRKEQELRAVRDCDATLVVSEHERELLAKEVPGARVMVISTIHELFEAKRPFAERGDFLFVGGFQHPPNVDAAIWFVREILPRARPRLPSGATFFLVGSLPPPEVRALAGEGVVVTGQVADLGPWFERARMSVAPLRYGAGVKGKVNTSMAYGVPVVATSMAVEGMHLRAGEDALVADDPDAFADAMVRLWNDEALWSRLAENGRRSIREHFSFDAGLRGMRELDGLLSRSTG